MANADFFLKLEGIEGESQDSKHKGEIELESFSWGATNTATGHVGGGAGSGKVNVQDIHFVKKIDKSSPKLCEKVFDGMPIKTGILICRKAGGNQQEYLTWKLTDVMISSYQAGGSAGSPILTEQYSLNFSKIELEYKEQKPDGTLGGAVKAGYDLKANKKV